MGSVERPIHPVVCQKSDFYRNSDGRNSQKLDPLQIPVKKFRTKFANLLKIFLQEIDSWCIAKVE
jgi:hypothetical protein